MKLFIYLFLLSLLFTACNDTKKYISYNGKQLLQEKCASCHNLNLPPAWDKSELAPPMMAVTFHVYDLLTPDITQKISTSKEFIKSYVINPNRNKSLCDKESLKQYGLMPSQKGKVSIDELEAISIYMLEYYTKENLYKIQAAKKYMDSLSMGERLSLKFKCNSCHKTNKKLVGPSFKLIAKTSSINQIKNSIKNGSKNNYKNIKATMPAFKYISKEQLDILSSWIKNVK